MAEAVDPDLEAAEFVLGTLSADERQAFLRRLAREPEVATLVHRWRERLAPLAVAAPDVEPPAELWPRIEQAIEGPVAANDPGAGRWKAAAIAAALVAAVTSGVAWQSSRAPVPTAPAAPIKVTTVSATDSVAALSPDGKTPGLFLAYDRDTGKLQVIPVGLEDDPAKSFELWLIKGAGAPKSVGTLATARTATVKSVKVDDRGDIVFAVSVEPAGGSKTGAPTGPVVLSGKLVDVPTT